MIVRRNTLAVLAAWLLFCGMIQSSHAQSAFDGVRYAWVECTNDLESCPVRDTKGTVVIIVYPHARIYAPPLCAFENIPKVTLVCAEDTNS
jgi:hypothetical protein